MGRLLERAGTADVVDAHLVVTATRHGSAILTSDPGDIRRLVDRADTAVLVHEL